MRDKIHSRYTYGRSLWSHGDVVMTIVDEVDGCLVWLLFTVVYNSIARATLFNYFHLIEVTVPIENISGILSFSCFLTVYTASQCSASDCSLMLIVFMYSNSLKYYSTTDYGSSTINLMNNSQDIVLSWTKHHYQTWKYTITHWHFWNQLLYSQNSSPTQVPRYLSRISCSVH